MHPYCLTVTAALLTGAALCAQSPAPAAAPALDPRNALDAILMRWENAMKGVNSLSVGRPGGPAAQQMTRTTLEKAFQNTEVFEGYAKYMKPNLAVMVLTKRNKPAIYEKYVCTGTFLYWYVPQDKKIRVYEMPQAKDGRGADDNFLTFLFGMKAADAKKKYDLTLLPAPANDKWYSYILIKPKTEADRKDFAKARLVLNNATFLPRQLWFEQPNGNEITWDFPRLVVNGNDVQRADFAMPQLEKGWEFDRMKPKVQPRVVRPNNQ
jgi:TIGR03009 family protein